MSENLTPELQFKRWVRTADRRERYTYHVGFLGIDRFVLRTTKWGQLEYVPNPPIDFLANAAMDASLAGRVHLLQLKLGEGMYAYIAERR